MTKMKTKLKDVTKCNVKKDSMQKKERKFKYLERKNQIKKKIKGHGEWKKKNRMKNRKKKGERDQINELNEVNKWIILFAVNIYIYI